MRKKKEYFGIKFNDDIPRIDKVNKYSKEIEIEFEGEAYLVERDDDNEIIERTRIENNYKLKKEDDYEIEFFNKKGEVFYLYVRIETSYLFIIILLFLLGLLIGFLMCKPTDVDNSPLVRFFDYINMAILQLDINKMEEIEEESKKIEKQYDFDVNFENITSDDIKLTNTISAKSLARNKIAPGVGGNFSINISTKKSTTDMRYNIKFQDVTDEKPMNMTFSINGFNKQYSTLQELQSDLVGIIKKKSKKTITINWNWNYESGQDESTIIQNDLIDTEEGKKLESYKFKIIVVGEEVI